MTFYYNQSNYITQMRTVINTINSYSSLTKISRYYSNIVDYSNSFLEIQNECTKNKKPLICIEGFLCPRGDTAIVLQKIKNRKIYSFELINHFDINRYTTQMNDQIIIRDLKNCINYLSLEQVTLMGFSLGGRLAIQYASLYPENIDSVITYQAAIGKVQYPSVDYFMQILWQINSSQFTKQNFVEQLKKLLKKDIDPSWQLQNEFLLEIINEFIEFDDQDKMKWKINFKILHQYFKTLTALDLKYKYFGPSLVTYGGKSTMKINLQDFKRVLPNLNFSQDVIKFQELAHGGPKYSENKEQFANLIDKYLQKIDQKEDNKYMI